MKVPRRLLAATLALPFAAARAQAATGLDRLREETRPVPAVSFTDAEGKEHGFEAFRGQGLVVNLWATWCPPCVAEMPALDRLAGLLEADGIAVLPLSSDRGGKAQVQGFYERTGIRTLGIWLDPRGAATRALGVRGLPTTLILDRAGQERARLLGEAEWDKPPLVEAVRRLAGG